MRVAARSSPAQGLNPVRRRGGAPQRSWANRGRQNGKSGPAEVGSKTELLARRIWQAGLLTPITRQDGGGLMFQRMGSITGCIWCQIQSSLVLVLVVLLRVSSV